MIRALWWSLSAAVLLLTGCTAVSPAPPGPSWSTGADAPDAHHAAAAADVVRVGVLEWSVEVDASLVAAGDVDVVVTNTGASRHQVVVEGEEGRWETPLLDPGATHELQIRTSAGEVLVIGCIVTGHEAHAPEEMLRVADR